MKIMLSQFAYKPERAHDTDAGIDLKSSCDMEILPHKSAIINTGVRVELPHGYAGLLVSKSGLNCKHGITSTGLIDEGYTGEIIVKLYNHSDEPYRVHEGDKITQLVLIPVSYEPLEVVDSIDGGERGDGGFGSTGR